VATPVVNRNCLRLEHTAVLIADNRFEMPMKILTIRVNEISYRLNSGDMLFNSLTFFRFFRHFSPVI